MKVKKIINDKEYIFNIPDHRWKKMLQDGTAKGIEPLYEGGGMDNIIVRDDVNQEIQEVLRRNRERAKEEMAKNVTVVGEVKKNEDVIAGEDKDVSMGEKVDKNIEQKKKSNNNVIKKKKGGKR